MEKLIYLIHSPQDPNEADFLQRLRGSLAGRLADAPGVSRLRTALADADVEPARALRMQSGSSLPDAMISVWLDSCLQRGAFEALLADSGCAFAGYLVTESQPLVNEQHAEREGERLYGMCQVALLQQPPRLSYAEWLEIWQGSHTQVAIDTQSTFAYRQNVVVRALTPNAPPCQAIVEENFPPQAMTSSHVFYNAGDDAQLKAHTDAMMASCTRFIDFDKIDVIPMSEYIIRA